MHKRNLFKQEFNLKIKYKQEMFSTEWQKIKKRVQQPKYLTENYFPLYSLFVLFYGISTLSVI